jgi:hypothetical protein
MCGFLDRAAALHPTDRDRASTHAPHLELLQGNGSPWGHVTHNDKQAPLARGHARSHTANQLSKPQLDSRAGVEIRHFQDQDLQSLSQGSSTPQKRDVKNTIPGKRLTM